MNTGSIATAPDGGTDDLHLDYFDHDDPDWYIMQWAHERGLDPADVVVSCHACGALTDLVLSRASTARARVAVLPCCHDEETCDMGGLGGWLESSLAIDVVRAARLEASGYRVWTQTIPADITPKNRLLLGVPVGPASPRAAV